MSYLENKAKELVRLRLSRPNGGLEKILTIVESDLADVDDENDKLKYLTIVLEANEIRHNIHTSGCSDPITCGTDKQHEKINYYLQQEIRRLGFNLSEDVFTREEKQQLTDYLDKVLQELKDLKEENQVIKAEIEELKNLFILGKKNWRQMAAGKFGEMVFGGVISEATAKPILHGLNIAYQAVIGIF